jgi:thiamine pyrophosphokinase
MKNQQYGHFVSFVPMTDEVIISLKGVKYPLDHYELRQGLSICQSNEIVMDKAEVLLEKGCVVVFETLD